MYLLHLLGAQNVICLHVHTLFTCFFVAIFDVFVCVFTFMFFLYMIVLAEILRIQTFRKSDPSWAPPSAPPPPPSWAPGQGTGYHIAGGGHGVKLGLRGYFTILMAVKSEFISWRSRRSVSCRATLGGIKDSFSCSFFKRGLGPNVPYSYPFVCTCLHACPCLCPCYCPCPLTS